jgi:hypothetical protein
VYVCGHHCRKTLTSLFTRSPHVLMIEQFEFGTRTIAHCRNAWQSQNKCNGIGDGCRRQSRWTTKLTRNYFGSRPPTCLVHERPAVAKATLLPIHANLESLAVDGRATPHTPRTTCLPACQPELVTDVFWFQGTLYVLFIAVHEQWYTPELLFRE